MENTLTTMDHAGSALVDSSNKLVKTTTNYTEYGTHLSFGQKMRRIIERREFVETTLLHIATYFFFGVCIYLFCLRFYIKELAGVIVSVFDQSLSTIYEGMFKTEEFT